MGQKNVIDTKMLSDLPFNNTQTQDTWQPKDIKSIDEESANEQRAKRHCDKLSTLLDRKNKINCTQFSKDSRVFLDFF